MQYSRTSVDSSWSSDHEDWWFLSSLVAEVVVPGKTAEEVMKAHYEATETDHQGHQKHYFQANNDGVAEMSSIVMSSGSDQMKTLYYAAETDQARQKQYYFQANHGVADQKPSIVSSGTSEVIKKTKGNAKKIIADVGIPAEEVMMKAHYDAVETHDQARQKHFLQQANHGTHVADQKPLSIVSSFSELMQKTKGKEKKRGTPWTVEEHERFLEGLKTYGKGHWKDISTNVVTTRTPAQIASHAQKHFLRKESLLKDDQKKKRRRSSIHDITTTTTAAADTTAVAHAQPPPPPPLTSLTDTSIFGGLSPIRFCDDIDAKLPLTQSPVNFYSDQLSINYFCRLEADDFGIYGGQKGEAPISNGLRSDPTVFWL